MRPPCLREGVHFLVYYATGLSGWGREMPAALQRANLASWRRLANVSGLLSIRSPQPYDRLPMWRIAEQTILRWQPCIEQI
jgi:hypothetical protein